MIFKVGFDCVDISLRDAVYSYSLGLVRSQLVALLVPQAVCRRCLRHRNHPALLLILSHSGQSKPSCQLVTI